MTGSPEVTETFPIVDGVALRLSFTPDAIREHFDGDDDDPTEGLTDEQLYAIASAVLSDDSLYEAFHAALRFAFDTVNLDRDLVEQAARRARYGILQEPEALPKIGDIVVYSRAARHTTVDSTWIDGTWNSRLGKRFVVADTAYDEEHKSVLVKSVGTGFANGEWPEEDAFVAPPESFTIEER